MTHLTSDVWTLETQIVEAKSQMLAKNPKAKLEIVACPTLKKQFGQKAYVAGLKINYTAFVPEGNLYIIRKEYKNYIMRSAVGLGLK